jgi:hypothetical protein
MLAVEHWYTSAAFWGPAAGVLAAVVVGLATIIVTLRVIPQRRIICSIISGSPLLTAPEPMRDDLEIRYQNERVERPNVATLEIINIGRNAIPSESFDKDRGLLFGVTARIIKVLTVDHSPPSAPTPHVDAIEGGLELKPELIVVKETITVSLLTEGPVQGVNVSFNPLADVKVDIRDREAWQRQRARRTTITAGFSGILILLAVVLFFVLVNPFPNPALTQLQRLRIRAVCASMDLDRQATGSQIRNTLEVISTAHSLKHGEQEFLSTAHYNAMVGLAAAHARRLTHTYHLAADTMRLGSASDVPASTTRAVAILARLPKEGTGDRASNDLAQVSATLDRLSSTQAQPPLCRS